MVPTILAISASFFGDFAGSIGVANAQTTLSLGCLPPKKDSTGRTGESSIAKVSVDSFVTNFTVGNNFGFVS